MRLGPQLSLHEKEAKLLHKLKGHCELIEAYNWHKLSAERQADFTKKLLDELGPEDAYFHFDFKENVRYPMSKEETGDEWHAQNKLSLTVFGCVVYTPGRKNFNFLLVSEVLDHDLSKSKSYTRLGSLEWQRSHTYTYHMLITFLLTYDKRKP